MTGALEFEGGPGAEEAAAIAAVITRILSEEAAARSRPPQAPVQSTWVTAWRPRDIPAPLPSHIYDAQPWGEFDAGDPIDPR